MKRLRTRLGTAAAILLIMALLCGCGGSDRGLSPARWRYAPGNIICIGDSLTVGSYFGQAHSGETIRQNYPYYLARMLSAEVTVAAKGGYSASDWYAEFSESYDWKDYDTALIWLGTNYAPTDTLDTDVLPFSDPASFAETETGYYCRIIEEIRRENPGCLIFLMTIFASKSDVEEANRAIAAIAAHYDLPVIDMSGLDAPTHPELHAGSNQNPHFGKAGNLYIASRLVDAFQTYFEENAVRSEYGITILPEG